MTDMKKYIILFLALVCIVSHADAQFESGESFLSGSFHTDLGRSRNNSADFTQSNFRYAVNISVGRFVRDNKAVGWSLSNSLSLHSVNKAEYMKPLQSLGFGISRFVEYYKPLGGKFAVYVRPSINVFYTLNKEYSGTETLLIYEVTRNKVSLGAGLEAGLAWRFGTKWAMYGSVAFSNPISVSTSLNHQKYTDGALDQKGTSFEYNFNPMASSGQIGLGLRYFCGKK